MIRQINLIFRYYLDSDYKGEGEKKKRGGGNRR